MYKYLITIRKHQVKDYVDKSLIDEIKMYIKLKHDSLKIIKECYEVDKKYKQLHYHAVVEINHKVWFKDNSKYKDFRIHWSPVGSMCGAIKYVLKEASNEYEQEQILIKNYYCHNYGFIDDKNKNSLTE